MTETYSPGDGLALREALPSGETEVSPLPGPAPAESGPAPATVESRLAALEAVGLQSVNAALTAETVRGSRRAFRLAGLGDSFTDGTSASDTLTSFTDSTWLHLTRALSMGRISHGGNFGIGGQTIPQILARVGDVLAAAPSACLILAGTNDIGGGTSDQIIRDRVQQLFTDGHDVLAAAGILPIAATIPPRGIAASPATATQLRQINQANVMIKHLARKRGIPLVDFHRVLVDPTTGRFLAAASGDAVHANRLYMRKLAETVVAALAPMLGATRPDLAQDNAESSNLLSNGLFLGGTTLVASSPQPDGWTAAQPASVRAVTAPVAADDLLGNWYDITRDAANGAANGGLTELRQNVAAGAGTFAVGDLVRFTCRVRLENLEGTAAGVGGLHYATVVVQQSNAGSSLLAVAPAWQWTVNIADAVLSADFIVAPGTTSLDTIVSLAGEGKVRVGQMTLRNLSTLGLA